MARKNVLVHTLPEFDLSMSFTSDPTSIEYLDNCSYQINCVTTDSIGTFSIEASNDYDPGGPISGYANPGTWIPIDLGAASGGAGTPFVNAADTNILISMNQLPFVATRLAYTPSVAGTGTCVVTIADKQLGG